MIRKILSLTQNDNKFPTISNPKRVFQIYIARFSILLGSLIIGLLSLLGYVAIRKQPVISILVLAIASTIMFLLIRLFSSGSPSLSNNKDSAIKTEATGGLAHKWMVLIAIICGIFIIVIDTTMVNIAFQTIRREYDASLTTSQWIISIYVLALGIALPISGQLAARFGIKAIYISGLATFVFGSLLCGLAPTLSDSIWLLIASRALQGFGGGLAQPHGSAQLFRTFPAKDVGIVLGIFGIVLVITPALGLFLSGLLVDQGLWPSIFFINVPIGIVAMMLASRLLPEYLPEFKPKFDILGSVTVTIGFGAVLYAVSLTSVQSWTSTTVLTWFAVGAVAIALFALIELFVAKNPLLNLRLFGSPTFFFASLIGYITALCLFGSEFLLPVYLQALRGRTALQAGIILLPLVFTSGVITPLAGMLYQRLGPRVPVVAGFVLLAVNSWQLSQIQGDTPIGWVMFLFAIRGAALALTVQSTFVTALGSLPRWALAGGSSLINSTRFIVQSIGVAVLAIIVASALSPTTTQFQGQFQKQAGQISSSQPFGLCETPGVPPYQNVPPGVPASALPQVQPVIQELCGEYINGFQDAYKFTYYIVVVGLVVGLFLPGWPHAWARRSVVEDEKFRLALY